MKNNTLTTPLEKILSLVEIFLSEPDGFLRLNCKHKPSLRAAHYSPCCRNEDPGYWNRMKSAENIAAGHACYLAGILGLISVRKMINAFPQEFSRQSFPETLLLSCRPGANQVLRQIEGHQTIRCSYHPAAHPIVWTAPLAFFQAAMRLF
jgi:hypothetical protein